LLIIDEAARVPDDLYRALRPMVAVLEGRIFCLGEEKEKKKEKKKGTFRFIQRPPA
jgi:hypothetical protein